MLNGYQNNDQDHTVTYRCVSLTAYAGLFHWTERTWAVFNVWPGSDTALGTCWRQMDSRPYAAALAMWPANWSPIGGGDYHVPQILILMILSSIASWCWATGLSARR